MRTRIFRPPSHSLLSLIFIPLGLFHIVIAVILLQSAGAAPHINVQDWYKTAFMISLLGVGVGLIALTVADWVPVKYTPLSGVLRIIVIVVNSSVLVLSIKMLIDIQYNNMI